MPKVGPAMIIDSQVHLWVAERPDRPWPPGGPERAHLRHPLTYDVMLNHMDEAGVDRAIIVPPSWEGDRNDYAIEAAQKHPDRFAVMGRIALDDPAARTMVPKWRDQPGMLGIRLTFKHKQATWLTDGTASWLWAAAEAAGIPLMVHPRGNTKALAAIADRHPELRLIVDHMGLNVNIANEGKIAEAIANTSELARHKNISVKLSSTPTYSSAPYPFRDMYAHIHRLVRAFGPRRCFWGTDLTHSYDKCSYRQRLTHFTEELDFLSAEDKHLIMGAAIAELLDWPEQRP